MHRHAGPRITIRIGWERQHKQFRYPRGYARQREPQPSTRADDQGLTFGADYAKGQSPHFVLRNNIIGDSPYPRE